ncbi:hypothetical protein TCDM_12162 [Trypanosoma cruzi Dm28c]|uniref:Uncharacterized protein n=1 Tax=Trypanosoma cruzi Dm28c TaxID=1416333 RepID=V5AYK8_TRYCR|nr:hypothetical protein TCDM_12162 [Trypanosoma cruzi Dm28c]
MQGDTHRERVKEECVCGRCTALSPSLSRGHRSSSRTRNKKKQKRGGGVGDRGAAVTVARFSNVIHLYIFECGRFFNVCLFFGCWLCFIRFFFFVFASYVLYLLILLLFFRLFLWCCWRFFV